MGRKSDTVTIDSPGRDLGKTFIVNEMPATLGKPWLMKVTLLLGVQGVDIKGLGKSGGKAALAMVMDDSSLSGWRDCVQYKHAPEQMPQKIFWDVPACQIEEIETVTFLQVAVLEMHMGFTRPVSP